MAGGGWVGGGSGPGGHSGAEGVKQGRGQSACQTRACAVCAASVLWVSAAVAAWGWVPWGSSRCSSPGPRAAPAAADTRCGNSRRRAGGRRGGGLAGHPARGEPERRAWGRGAGGAGERPESRRGRRSGSQPERPRSWPHLRRADGRPALPCLALPSSPAPHR